MLCHYRAMLSTAHQNLCLYLGEVAKHTDSAIDRGINQIRHCLELRFEQMTTNKPEIRRGIRLSHDFINSPTVISFAKNIPISRNKENRANLSF